MRQSGGWDWNGWANKQNRYTPFMHRRQNIVKLFEPGICAQWRWSANGFKTETYVREAKCQREDARRRVEIGRKQIKLLCASYAPTTKIPTCSNWEFVWDASGRLLCETKKHMRMRRWRGWMVGKQTKSLCAAYAPTTKIAELFESSLIKWDENCRPVVPKPSRMLVTESGGEGNR